MNDKLAAQIISFKGDDELHVGKDVVLQITDTDADGMTEIAFDEPLTKVRHYVKFDFGQLAARVAANGRTHES